MSRFDRPTISVEGGSSGRQNITWQSGGSRRPSKPSSSSSGGGSSYRSSGGGTAAAAAPASSGNAYSSILQSWYDQQRAAAEAAEAAKRAAAQAAYDRGMAALGNAYNSMLGNLQENYDSSLGTLQDSYDSGVRGTNQQADKTMNEAYVNYMLTRRDMPQLLAAQGVNGGAAESTYASLLNNYGRPAGAAERQQGQRAAGVQCQQERPGSAAHGLPDGTGECAGGRADQRGKHQV